MSDTDSDTASSAGSIIEDVSEADISSFKCLFCAKEWGNVSEMFSHCETDHQFPIKSLIKEIGLKLEELGIIKLINYLRLEAQTGTEPSKITVTADTLKDDKYLVPTLSEDPLLFELGDFMPETSEKAHDYDEYEAALARNLPDDVSKIDFSGDRDERYFDSYKGNNIHREMIEDRLRTESYRDFISKYSHLFKDKVVLDVGCGTSILSLFCARAGAKKVFAVDNSDIALRAREIVKQNGYEGVVEVIQGRVEDFHMQHKIGKGNVDIIVSEWMGYGLLFEGMLDSVLKARDIYLKPGGLLVPSHCTLRVAPISDTAWISDSTGEKFWKNVYGFDFSPMIPGGLLNDKEVGVFDVPPTAISGTPSTFYKLDLGRITVQELDFTVPFETTLERDVESLDAFAIWFDNFFLSHGEEPDLNSADALKWTESGKSGVAFSTGPYGTATHWHQAVVLLNSQDRGKPLKKTSVLKGEITYQKRRGDARGVEVEVTWVTEGLEGKVRRTMA